MWTANTRADRIFSADLNSFSVLQDFFRAFWSQIVVEISAFWSHLSLFATKTTFLILPTHPVPFSHLQVLSHSASHIAWQWWSVPKRVTCIPTGQSETKLVTFFKVLYLKKKNLQSILWALMTGLSTNTKETQCELFIPSFTYQLKGSQLII